MLFVLPPPRLLRAKATWIVARNWLAGARLTLESARLVTPDGEMTDEALGAVINSRTPSVRKRLGWRRAVPQTLRTLARDAEIGLRRSRLGAGDVESMVSMGRSISLVWQHHSLFFRAGESYARRLKVPLVQFVEALQVWEARRWGVRRPGWGSALERYGELPQLRAADVVACVTQDVADAVAELGVSPTRIVVAPNVADPALFFPGDGSAARRSIGIPPNAFVAGWVGSFRPFHGLDALISAFASIASAHADVSLLLVGDGQERSRVEAQIKELGLERRVFLTGEVPYDDVGGLIRAMDVGVISSRSQDSQSFHYSPLKLREFVASAVPVVAPDVGEIRREFAANPGVLLYPPGESAGIRANLSMLLRDRSAAPRLGAVARAEARTACDVTRPVQSILERVRDDQVSWVERS